jgi:hypothetical protein
MRPIDADALLEEIEEEIEAEKSYDNYDKGVTAGLRIALRDVKKQPTIEAITREQFAEAAKQLMNEFTANDGYGTSASATFLALCFGNLELRLFKREGGDNDGKD